MPFFSIIIPTYNRADFLVSTIESILSQNFTDFELLIIDDGSTDKTPELIPNYFQNEPRLKYFRKKNEERSIARNFGMQKAQGNYVVFFDSDDFMHANHLEVLHQKIMEFPECLVFATKYQTDYQGNKIKSDHHNSPEGFYDYSFLLKGNVLGVLICLKINPLPKHLFHPDFNMCEDWIFNIQNLKNTKIYLIHTITITVSGHENRSMANDQKAITGRMRAMNYLLENVSFTESEQRIIQGHSYRFCMIHAYLANSRNEAVKFWRKMIYFLGFQPSFFISLLKIFIGKKTISYIQKII